MVLLNLIFKPAEMNDCDLLYKWVNDETVRRNSFNSQKIAYENHKAWFENRLNSDKCFIFVVYSEDTPIGQIRLDIDRDIGIINYSIDRQFRGMGYGTEILRGITELPQLHSKRICKLIGNVKIDNISSQKAFERAGYVHSIKDEYIEYSIVLDQKNGG